MSLLGLAGSSAAGVTPWLSPVLIGVSVIRLRGDEVLAACGGDTAAGPLGNRLRRAVLETLQGAVPVIHDEPGSLAALEAWLQVTDT